MDLWVSEKGSEIGIANLEVVEALRHQETYQQNWHVHGNALELHCVFSGAISYEFGDAHSPVTIPGGFILAIPAGVRHRAVDAEGTPSVRLVTRWLRPSGRIPLSPFSLPELKELLRTAGAQPFEVRRMSPRLARAAREIFRALEENDAAYVRRLAAWNFLAEAAVPGETLRSADSASEPGMPAGNVDTIMAALCAYIRERCGEPIHMADLVKISGYSERRLFSLFHERIGLTPGNYITRCRIDRAKERIAASSHPRLLDIALSCGFSSASHFSAVFRKYVGKSPRAYLNRNE
ncbi:MAG: helix-turn-helix domain-containing protein [Kiritimatiellae bacterium]|nr:helix-turn-helix domain-containing protein [Kiritimatiellia bacterium]